MSNKNGDTSPSQLSGSSEDADMEKRAANLSGSDTTNMSTKSANQQKERNEGEGVALPLSLMKALRRKPSSVGIGSNSSNEGGSGNNSDNSALVSLGNNSFGFNFDSEEGLLNNSSPANSETDAKTGESESKRRQRRSYVPSEVQTKSDRSGRKRHSISKSSSGSGSGSSGSSGSGSGSGSGSDNGNGDKSTVSSLTSATPSSGSNKNGPSISRGAAAGAAEAVSNLHPLTTTHTAATGDNRPINHHQSKKATTKAKKVSGKKRKAEPSEDTGNDSGGYNSDDEGGTRSTSAAPHGAPKTQQHPQHPQQHPPQHPEPATSASITTGKHVGPLVTDSSSAPSAPQSADSANEAKKKGKFLDENKREERNAREKERSFRISKQINELRNLLSSGGVIVPKGTKSSVLTEAANYIRMLQQHQYRSEIDRHHLIQQMQMIGTGAMGPQAAQAIRHAAAQNGVWSLGNFGGVPPRSAMSYYEQGKSGVPGNAVQSSSTTTPENNPQTPQLAQSVEDHEYRHIFNSCPLGMAIASMGGAFVDCNQLFCQLSNYTKQEICSMTIFNLTSRQDLQPAFDLISQMISPPAGPLANASTPVVLRGSMKNRDDLGLSVALIKGEDGIAKNFSVTLIRNPASPFDPSHPIPATADLIQTNTTEPVSQPRKENGAGALPTEPAYTTG